METGGLGGDAGPRPLGLRLGHAIYRVSIYDSVCGARFKEDLFHNFYKVDNLQCSWPARGFPRYSLLMPSRLSDHLLRGRCQEGLNGVIVTERFPLVF
jgi:hypothetical protein